jgi:hypothetical protein
MQVKMPLVEKNMDFHLPVGWKVCLNGTADLLLLIVEYCIL